MHVSRAPGAMIKKSKTLTEGEFFSTVVFPREDDFIEGKRWAHTRVQKMEGKSFKNTHPVASGLRVVTKTIPKYDHI